MQENLKTFGAVEVVLGLLEVSLGSLLHQVETFFNAEIIAIFITGAWTIMTGFGLICGGTKPSYGCVKCNMILHLASLSMSSVSFSLMVKHVPYKQDRYCNNRSCDYVSMEVMFLVGGILIILVSILVVHTLVNLALLLTGLCLMLSDPPQQSEDPECIGSTTSERLCPAPPQNQETPEGDAVKTDSQ